MGRLKAYFHLLDLAADTDISMETVALPLIGTGVQKIQADQILRIRLVAAKRKRGGRQPASVLLKQTLGALFAVARYLMLNAHHTPHCE